MEEIEKRHLAEMVVEKFNSGSGFCLKWSMKEICEILAYASEISKGNTVKKEHVDVLDFPEVTERKIVKLHSIN